jgi:3-deoxy-manno-octulosonate cytidylyltransferase (CMP-KDO synthetase)
MKLAAIIPARLASTRFPRKVLFEFNGVPMVEHVRLRAEISEVFDAGVYVATCDQEVFDIVGKNGGLPIMTSIEHQNGTSRVAEAVEGIDCTHVVVLQGDEPLLLPRHLKEFAMEVKKNPEYHVWNGVSDIYEYDDFSNETIVKCAVNKHNDIVFCFRGKPFVSSLDIQSQYVKKMLGLIAFKKESIKEISNHTADILEINEGIEQMRAIGLNYKMKSINLGESFPSVNIPSDAEIVSQQMICNKDQVKIMSDYSYKKSD